MNEGFLDPTPYWQRLAEWLFRSHNLPNCHYSALLSSEEYQLARRYWLARLYGASGDTAYRAARRSINK